jgi:hypothetical protein
MDARLDKRPPPPTTGKVAWPMDARLDERTCTTPPKP